MRVLIPFHAPDAALIHDLAAALRSRPDIDAVDVSLDRFWDADLERPTSTTPDVVAVHWPEAFFRWQEPDGDAVRRLSSRLRAWKRHACLIATAHNWGVHYRESEQFDALFRAVYDEIDGLIHFGEASVEAFQHRFPALRDTPAAVIPLPVYGRSFRKRWDQEEARAVLGVRQDAFVCLSLGKLRHDRELVLLLDGFRGLKHPRKQLIIAGRARPPRGILRRWWRLAVLKWHPRVRTRLGSHIPNDEVCQWVSAADVVVIPRYAVLNSGSVPLGFMFGKVVVGPDSGVVGEVLAETGNPRFVPGDPEALARALQHAVDLVAEGQGEANRRHSSEHWSLPRVAEQTAGFYERVLSRRRLPS